MTVVDITSSPSKTHVEIGQGALHHIEIIDYGHDPHISLWDWISIDS
jgi:hypothetical protein